MPDGLFETRLKGAGFEFFAYEARETGTIASQALRTNDIGRVIAVFDRSFYVEFDAGLVCVGGVDLPIGPLNIVTTAPTRTNWRASGVCVDDRASLLDGSLRIGRRFHFDLTESVEWSPSVISERWTAGSLTRGLTDFRIACLGCVPEDGLGAFVHGDERSAAANVVHDKARGPVEALGKWLAMAFLDPEMSLTTRPEGLEDLLGLGPGLTPSGDDFMGGMMIAARILGEVGVCHLLWDMIRPAAVVSGNPIVLAHLSAASEGFGCPELHQAIAAILIGRRGVFDRIVGDIGAIGHTSGWDTMAGVTHLFDAWLQTR